MDFWTREERTSICKVYSSIGREPRSRGSLDGGLETGLRIVSPSEIGICAAFHNTSRRRRSTEVYQTADGVALAVRSQSEEYIFDKKLFTFVQFILIISKKEPIADPHYHIYFY